MNEEKLYKKLQYLAKRNNEIIKKQGSQKRETVCYQNNKGIMWQNTTLIYYELGKQQCFKNAKIGWRVKLKLWKNRDYY